MKLTGGFLCLVGLLLGIGLIWGTVEADYNYTNTVYSNWILADNSSTIEAKSEYVDKFVTALKSQNLTGVNDAIWYYTPNNSFDYNLAALETLQSRLHEIKHMDPNSFQYQMAIHQITEQEMSQAEAMLNVFEGVYYKHNYYMLWGPWAWFWSLLSCFLVIFGIVRAVLY